MTKKQNSSPLFDLYWENTKLNDKNVLNFINGFMADDATLVYIDRQKAANVLWKHVKHFMEAETIGSRYKYDYSRLWLEKYEDKLEKFKERS